MEKYERTMRKRVPSFLFMLLVANACAPALPMVAPPMSTDAYCGEKHLDTDALRRVTAAVSGDPAVSSEPFFNAFNGAAAYWPTGVDITAFDAALVAGKRTITGVAVSDDARDAAPRRIFFKYRTGTSKTNRWFSAASSDHEAVCI
jgi:hypothetical protein